jgi:hypothetical protein
VSGNARFGAILPEFVDHTMIIAARCSQEDYRKNDWHSSANRALLSPPRRDITLAWGSCPAGSWATAGLRW